MECGQPLEHRLEDGVQILDVLHALEPASLAHHALVVLGVHQAHAERVLHVLGGAGSDDGRVREDALELLERRLLAFVEDLAHLGVGLECRLDLLPLGLCGGLPCLAAPALRVLGAQEHRDFDPVVETPLGQIHLHRREESRPEERQGHAHRDDDRDGHR